MNTRAVTLTCPGGLEELVAQEATALGLVVEEKLAGAVTARATLEGIYRACLWGRFGNHVLVHIASCEPANGDALYAALLNVDWQAWLKPGQRFVIGVSGKHEGFNNPQNAIYRTKDAIVDHFVRAGLIRPQVDREAPDAYLQLHLAGTRATIYFNANGAPLHERGYRVANVTAPMKENLAASLAAWGGLNRSENSTATPASFAPDVVYDPMCGGATLLIEAAWMLADIAPGLLRDHWGFTAWQHHDAALWASLMREARQRREAGLRRPLPKFLGHDAEPKAVRAAQANIAAAGLGTLIHIEKQAIAALQARGVLTAGNGVVLCNPPYGERLSGVQAAPYLYRCLGRKMRAALPGWRAVVLATQVEHLDEFRVPAETQNRCHNGPLTCFARVFRVPSEPVAPWPEFRLRDTEVKDAEAEPLANRLRKNWQKLSPWVKKEGIRAFRLYDADLPEFNVAVDVYGDRIHVQEYAAPNTIDPEKAAHRLEVALGAISAVTGKPRHLLALKVRSKQKGAQQYVRQDQREDLFEIEEHGARLLVNLTDYLDTGLFLDHRPVRHRLQALCRDKHFLNLFCYTGTASVHAAIGGARSTTSVDLNPNYLAWAEANLALNGFSTHSHHLVAADVKALLTKGGDQFDVIFMDAPTFSNSKRTTNTLDIQRDHGELVVAAMRHLPPDGVLLFSNNYRRFKLDEAISRDFDVKDITRVSIPPDFARNEKIHQCWEIRHRG